MDSGAGSGAVRQQPQPALGPLLAPPEVPTLIRLRDAAVGHDAPRNRWLGAAIPVAEGRRWKKLACEERTVGWGRLHCPDRISFSLCIS